MDQSADDRADVAVIGAGVVGLAVARALALAGREVTVLEAERAPGQHTSSRNSEVIHAGLYYPPGSLKARLCVRGRGLLYAYCAERGVPHARIGKLLVACADGELAALQRIRETALANGVTDLRPLTPDEARSLEPEVRCVAALLSPSTGIVDSHALMAALRRDATEAGAVVALGTRVGGGRLLDGRVELETDAGRTSFSLVVNCAGLWAPDVARSLGVADVPAPLFAKGHYFFLAGRSPFRRLVYPMPSAGGLGIHVTLDLEGRTRFGPDVQWCDGVDYAFDESREGAFTAAIRRYWPALPGGVLRPGFTGVRPKIAGGDFVIQRLPSLINLYGIESPGLTACLALADEVTRDCCSSGTRGTSTG